MDWTVWLRKNRKKNAHTQAQRVVRIQQLDGWDCPIWIKCVNNICTFPLPEDNMDCRAVWAIGYCMDALTNAPNVIHEVMKPMTKFDHKLIFHLWDTQQHGRWTKMSFEFSFPFFFLNAIVDLYWIDNLSFNYFPSIFWIFTFVSFHFLCSLFRFINQKHQQQAMIYAESLHSVWRVFWISIRQNDEYRALEAI